MATSSSSTAYGDVSHTIEGPSAAQWAAVQQEIRVLYLIDKKPLKHVRAILEERHGFRATERMFKSRLSTWKFTKNSSDKEYQICAVLHKTRRDKGKPHTAFIINGNRRTLKDLWKYIKGRKMSVEEFYAIACQTVGPDQLEDELQVRAITPEPEAEDGHDSDADSQHENGSLAKLTPSSSDASSSVRGPPRRQSRHHRTSTSSTTSLAHNLTYASLEPRSIPAPPSTSTAPLEPLHIQRGISTPDSYGTSPTSVGYAASALSQRSSPRRSFGRSDIESIAHSTIYSTPLQQTHGLDNLDAWAILSQGASDTSSLSDFDVICPGCHKPTSDHFSTPCNLDSPQSAAESPFMQRNLSPRDLLESTPDLPDPAQHFSIPVSTKQHDHSWKWVSHCFSACIYYSRSRYSDSSDHNLVENTPSAATAADDFMYARWDLDRANSEFRAMILNYDPNILVAINQTVMVLGMHNWNNITSHIMGSAAKIAREVLGEGHPIYLLARFVTLMSSQKTIYSQTEITSSTLENIWQAFVHGWSPPPPPPPPSSSIHNTTTQQRLPPYTIPAEGETGRRAIPALYCYASLLCTEAHLSPSPIKESKLAQAEYLLRHCHSLACRTFHHSHLQAIAALLKLHLVLDRQGRISDAIQVVEKAVEDGRATLGKWHPRQLESERVLAALIVRRWGVEDEGRAKLRRQQRQHQHQQGGSGNALGENSDMDEDDDDDDEDTRQTQQQEQQQRRRRQEEERRVESILWEVLEGRVRMLGRKHESSLASRLDLIKWLSERGRSPTATGSTTAGAGSVSGSGSASALDKQRLDDIWEWTDLGREDCGGSGGAGVGAGAVGGSTGRREGGGGYVQAGY